MLSDKNDEQREENTLSDEPFEEVMINQISMLLSQYEEEIRTLFDNQSDVREMKPLFQVFKQKERVYVKKWEKWLKNYGKHLEKSQFFLESDKAAALKMYFSNTLLHIRLLGENAIELAEINCKLRKPDAPTSTNRKDWKQIFNVLRTTPPQKEITSFQLGESLRQAIAKTAKKIETTFQQTPQLVDSLFRLGSKLKTNLLWWLHAHQLEMVRADFFSDKKSPVKTEATEPAAIQVNASSYTEQKKERVEEKKVKNRYAQYLEENEEVKLNNSQVKINTNQAITPFRHGSKVTAQMLPGASSSIIMLEQDKDNQRSMTDEEKVLTFGLHLVAQKYHEVNDHFERSERLVNFFCEENDRRLAQMKKDREQFDRELTKINQQQDADHQIWEEAQRKIERKLDAIRKQQEENEHEFEKKLEEREEEIEKKFEEKEEEIEKKLEEKEEEIEKKLEEMRKEREENEQKMQKKFEEVRILMFQVMKKMTEMETSQPGPSNENKETIPLHEAKLEAETNQTLKRNIPETSFVHSGEGFFTMSENQEEEKQEKIDEIGLYTK